MKWALCYSFNFKGVLRILILCAPFLYSTYSLSEKSIDNQISDLLNIGDVEGARKLHNDSSPTEIDIIFFEAKIAKYNQDYIRAIELFREVLRLKPLYLNAKRELAHTLLIAKKYEVAEFHFKELLLIDSNERLKQGYDNFLSYIENNKPYGISGIFSIIPSSNITNGPSDSLISTPFGEFQVDEDSTEESGVGIQAGLSGFLRKRLTPNLTANLKWSFSGVKYNIEGYDYITAKISPGYKYQTSKTEIGINPFFEGLWYEDNSPNLASNNSFGIEAYIFRQISQNIVLGAEVGHSYLRYPEVTDLNGPKSYVSIPIQYSIDPSLAIFSSIRIERGDASRPTEKYVSTQASFGLSKKWVGGFQTRFTGLFGNRKYKKTSPFFGEKRDDDFYQFSTTIQNNTYNIRGYTPQLSCSYFAQQSNSAFFEKDSAQCYVTMSRNF